MHGFRDCPPGDVRGVNATLSALSGVIERAEQNGIEELILDPAIGKWIPEREFEDDWELCRHFSAFLELERPPCLQPSHENHSSVT